MIQIAGQVLLHIVLIAAWGLFTNNANVQNLFVGAMISGGILLLFYRVRNKRTYLGRLYAVLKLIIVLIFEQIKSNLYVARLVLSKKYSIRPAIIRLVLDDMSDTEITAVTNMITLTPGTLSVHITEDRKSLYVHMINAGNGEEADLIESKDLFQRLVTEVTRG